MQDIEIDLVTTRQFRFYVSSRHFGVEEEFPIEYTVEYGEDPNLPEFLPPSIYITNAWVRRARAGNLYFLISSNIPADPLLQVVEQNAIHHILTDAECLAKMHALLPKLIRKEEELIPPVLPLRGLDGYDPDAALLDVKSFPLRNCAWTVPSQYYAFPPGFKIQMKVDFFQDTPGKTWYFEVWVRKMLHTERYRIRTFTLPITADPENDSFDTIEHDPKLLPDLVRIFTWHCMQGDLDLPVAPRKGSGMYPGPRHGKGKSRSRMRKKKKR